MRFLGPAAVRVSGDAAKKHLGYARKLLGEAHNQMTFRGLKQLKWRRELYDGSIVTVLSTHRLDFITIWSPEDKEEEEIYTFYLESGLLHIGEYQSTTPAYLYYGDQIQAAHDADVPQRKATLDNDDGLVSEKYASGLASEAVPGGGERKIAQLSVPASMFSGRMRTI